YTLSMQARADGARRLRLQLLDEAGNGTIGDFDLDEPALVLHPVGGPGRLDGDIAASGDWRALSLTATLSGPRLSLLVQLMDGAGASTFAPGGEAVLLRAVQVERGESATAYRAPP